MGTIRFRRINLRLLVILAIIAIMATAAYGFAASNTVPTSRAGDGSGQISGYKVSGIHYTMDNASPANISAVAFTLNQPASTVQVKLMSSGDTWHACSPTGSATAPATDWTCSNITGVTVVDADNLEVAAAD